MAFGFRALLAGLIASLVLPGCLARTHCSPSRGPATASLEMLPETPRQAIEPNLDGVSTPSRPIDRRGELGFRYYALSAEACQCRAAEASSLGNLLASEGPAMRSASKGRSKPGDKGRTIVLAGASDEARNLSAAKALLIYYALAEGEARLDLADRGLVEIDDTIAKVEQMRERGLEIPFDAGALERQRIDLEGKRAELILNIGRGNHELLRTLHFETHDPNARIWPAVELRVDSEPVDVDQEIAAGLAIRPELRVLRHLPCLPASESVGAVKMLLGGINPMLGSTSSGGAFKLERLLFPSKIIEAEAPARRAQLQQMRERREHELADEIRQAVEAIETRLVRVSLAKELVESSRRHVAETEKKQPIGKATFVEVALARMKLIEAEAEVVSSVVAWHGAFVQLRQLQGRLLEECPDCPGDWNLMAVEGEVIESVTTPPAMDGEQELLPPQEVPPAPTDGE